MLEPFDKYGRMDVDAFMDSFRPYLEANRRTTNTVFQVSLNPSPEDRLTDGQFRDIAQEYMERMGYGLSLIHICGTLVQKNELFTDYLQNGVAVNYFDGREQCSANVRLVDYDSPLHNRFTIANQWTVDGHSVRRADMIVFVNGLPLVVVELKSPSRENTDVSEAYAQLRNYMQEIPSLFIYNACLLYTSRIDR